MTAPHKLLNLFKCFFLVAVCLFGCCHSYAHKWFKPVTKNQRLSRPLPRFATVEVGGEEYVQPEDSFLELKNILKGTCVFFVGMMGVGKSSVGAIFAEKLGYRFLDTDEIAEFMIEMPISDFFAQGNEAAFRDLEYQILMEMAQYTRVVISTGGGIVAKKENWGLLRHGIVVFLDMTAGDLYTRLTADPAQIAKRPLLQTENPQQRLQELLDAR